MEGGGNGVVYKAYKPTDIADIQLYKAVKVISPESGSDREELKKDLIGEAATTAQIGSNPYVVGIEDFGEFPDHSLYLVFPFIKGYSLDALNRQHIDEGHLLPFELSAFIFHRIVSVLNQVHHHPETRLCHRDLCPNNLMIQRSSGLPLVLDWGSSNAFYDDLVVGKPAYICPEVVKGEVNTDWGFKSDIFSLGMIIRELIIGRNVLEIGSDSFDYREGIDMDKLAPLHECCPDVPKTLSDIIEACTQENPDLRPDAETLYDYLGMNYLYTSEIGFGLTQETMIDYLQFIESAPDQGESLPDNGYGRNLTKLISSKVRRHAEETGTPVQEATSSLEYTFGNIRRTFEEAFGARYRVALEEPFLDIISEDCEGRELDEEISKIKSASIADLKHTLEKQLAEETGQYGFQLAKELNNQIYDRIVSHIDELPR